MASPESSDDLAPHDRLQFTDPSFTVQEVEIAAVGGRVRLNDHLDARSICIDPAASAEELRMICPADASDPARAWQASEMLDNEILAGVRLDALARQWVEEGRGNGYPEYLTRLVGFQVDVMQPFVLTASPRGAPMEAFVGGSWVAANRSRMIGQLVSAVRWLSFAEISHRGISTRSVFWSNDSGAQLGNFFNATVIGSPRTVVGDAPWTAPEQSLDSPLIGTPVSERDDVWALGRLIGLALAGRPPDAQSLDELGLSEQLQNAFQRPPERRPSPTDLLRDFHLRDPLLGMKRQNAKLAAGRLAYDHVVTGWAPPPAVLEDVGDEAEGPKRGRRWRRGGNRQ